MGPGPVDEDGVNKIKNPLAEEFPVPRIKLSDLGGMKHDWNMNFCDNGDDIIAVNNG